MSSPLRSARDRARTEIRGAILDRRGNALAVSEEAATVFATPYQVVDPPKTARKLADVLDMAVFGAPTAPVPAVEIGRASCRERVSSPV